MPADSTITVGVRVRPLVSHEKGQQLCLKTMTDEVHVIPDAVSPQFAKEGPFKFDHAMDSTDSKSPSFVTNAKCYDIIGHTIVDHALDGYNSCLFCYGQTGTGKTTTILGDEKSGPGILICLFSELFERVRQEQQQGCEIKVHVQMLEVYNEKVFDLLADEPDAQHHSQHKIELHVLPAGVQVKGAAVREVQDVEQCLALIEHGNARKHVAATAMNPQSSRGHTVFKLSVHKDDQGHGVHMGAEIFFADLAGHENEKTTQVKGERLVELSFINKSLMWLQAAIHGLAKGGAGGHSRASMSDFRNSKLTLLLSNALTGNSLVNVVVTLSPAEAHMATSLSSLKFANEVKRIKIEVKSSAQKDPAAVIKNLEQEVETLKRQLAAALAAPPLQSPEASGPGAGNGAVPSGGPARPGHSGPEEFQEQLDHLEELQEELEEQEERLKQQERQERILQERMVAAAAADPTKSVLDLSGPCPDPAWDPSPSAEGSWRFSDQRLSDSQLAADTEALLRRVSRLGLQASLSPSCPKPRSPSPLRAPTRPTRSQSALLPQSHRVVAPIRTNTSSVVLPPQFVPTASRISGYGGSSLTLSMLPVSVPPGGAVPSTGGMPPARNSVQRVSSPKHGLRMR